jgi:nitrite reductase/ring-hydroxylating ferredoxin subunit
MRTVRHYVEDLLRSRRPKGFAATPEDAGLARTAITLRAARPGSGGPTEEFIAGLRVRLAGELDPAGPQRAGHRRRTFLRASTFAAGAAAAGAVGAAIDSAVAGHPGGPGPSQQGGAITPDSGSWQTIAAGADLPDGAVRSFSVNGVMGFVERTGGRLRAVSAICTHQGCQLLFTAGLGRLVCPCHGAQFATDGAVIWHRPGVVLTALPRLAVREAGGLIQVYAPRRA